MASLAPDILLSDTAHLVVAIMMAGTGLIFLRSDWRNSSSRVLALCLFGAAGATMFSQPSQVSTNGIVLAAANQLFETLALVFGVEWGRRLSLSAKPGRWVTAAGWLFRISQLILVIFGFVSLGYIALFPESAVVDPEGLIKVRPLEFAVFAPLLGTALLFAGAALIILLLVSLDPVERVRFHTLMVAGPIFLLTMLLQESLEPIIMALGLLLLLNGSVRYFIIQAQRGAVMRQFVSPQLADMLNLQGVGSATTRERREITVLACDLRGFTSYARETDSGTVIGLLETYYAEVGALAQEYGGTVKDHAGDGILILFGAPKHCDDYSRRAVNLAQTIIRRLGPILQATGAPLGIGAGIATGDATIGAIQGAGRMEYVAVGNVVNLAARLCDKAPNGMVLLDEATLSAADVASMGAAMEPMSMKGFDQPVAVFALGQT